MKKSLKITGIIFGVLIILAAFMYVFGWQFLVKMYVNKKYEHINCTAKEFPYGEVPVPEDWKTIECSGLTLKVPNEVYQHSPDDEREYKRRFFADPEKEYTTVYFSEWTAESEFTFMDEDDLSEKDIEKAMKSVDYKCPENSYELIDFVYNVTSKDLGFIRHGKSPKLIISVANMKEILVASSCAECDELYSFETEKGIGFLSYYRKPRDNDNKYVYVVHLYDKNNLNRSIIVRIGSVDKETAFKIAGTIAFAEE